MLYQEIRIISDGLSAEDMEVLIATLNDLGFDGFIEEEEAVKAYIPAGLYMDSHALIIRSFLSSRNIQAQPILTSIPYKNWNKEWEKNFNPVIVDGKCAVKASFHNIPEYKYTIIIDPEMAFGTGHHETTRLMIKYILNMDINYRDILDMGCGTGVLGILAAKMGAKSVTAIDIDEVACENTINNLKKNNIATGFSVLTGNVGLIKDETFDVILANINRNIILEDINNYFRALRPGGTLIISGMLTEDEDIIRAGCEENGFSFVSVSYENRWISLKLTR